MIDASHTKVRSHAAGAHGGSQEMGARKGPNARRRQAADAHRLPAGMRIPAGAVADGS